MRGLTDIETRLLAAIDRAPVISFDVFDTLLIRPVLEPHHLFLLMEQEVSAWLDDDLFSFHETRREAEQLARQQVKQTAGFDEVTLAEIYAEFATLARIDDASLVERIQRREIELERRYCRPHPFMQGIYRQAVARGKRVLFISDTYLPQDTVADLLDRHGYRTEGALFVSSASRLTKRQGALYAHVLAETGLKAGDILHIGDDREADQASARRHGLRTFQVARAADAFRANRRAARIWPRPPDPVDISRSVVLGTIANRLYAAKDWSPPGPHDVLAHDAACFGYQVMGPLLMALAQWILETAQQLGVEHLYFVSRDGLIMREAYRRIAADNPRSPPSTYLYASRRALNVARIKKLDTRTLCFLTGSSVPLRCRDYLERLTLTPERCAEAIREAGFASADDWIRNEGDRRKLVALFRALETTVLAIASRERELLLDYYRQVGLLDGERFGVVDIGWSGSMQYALTDLLGREDNKPIGLYLGTSGGRHRHYAGAETLILRGYTMKGYLFECGDPEEYSRAINGSIDLVEFLFSATHGSVVRFVREDGRVVPVLDDDDRTADRQQLLPAIQQGGLAFIDDVLPIFRQHRLAMLPKRQAIAPLRAVIRHPTKTEAALFGQVLHAQVSGDTRKLCVVCRPSLARLYLRPGTFARECREIRWGPGYEAQMDFISRRYFRMLLMLHRYPRKARQWYARWRHRQ